MDLRRGDSFGDFRGTPIAAADDLDRTRPSLMEGPVTITCGQGGVMLPRAAGITVLRMGAGTALAASSPWPRGTATCRVRTYVVVDRGPEEPLRVDCRDAQPVTVEAVSGYAASSRTPRTSPASRAFIEPC